MRLPAFIGPSYQLRSVNIDCQRSVNLYPEKHELGTGKEQEAFSLHGTPGLLLKLTLAQSPVRALYTASNGNVYAVGGNKLYSINSSFEATERGTLSTSSGEVSIADNGIDMVLVDGANGYYFTFGNSTFNTITDDDFLGANIVQYQDGYFIFNKPNSGQFYISGLNSTSIDPLDFALSEGNPDNLVGHISVHRELWMFNEKTTEVFFNSGNADFPFERLEGGFIEHGCAARFSIAKMNNTVFWLGKSETGTGIIYMANGYSPQRISTHAVEQAIQGYSDFSDAKAFCYQQEGHAFYVINFPTADTTWVYDTSTGAWHERTYTNDGVQERHRADVYSFGHDTHLVGDYENGKIYAFSLSTYDDDGEPITRLRVAPHITAGLARVTFHKFQLDMETGVGLDGITQGTDPQAMLQFSDDGGHKWSNEKWVSFGSIGARRARAIWRRLGLSRDRVFKIKITDPVKVVLIGAEIDVERMAS